MASIFFNKAKQKILQGDIDLNAATIKATLLMSGTDADTNKDADQIKDLSSLDECDGAGYTAGGETLANKTCKVDDANDRGVFDADDVTFNGISAGTRDLVGCLIYKSSGTQGDSFPIVYLEFASTLNGNGGDITVNFSTDGIFYSS
jgi:hypothetical protein